ncbi:unnamed protein product [Penicillium salamii]|nr:unnamed protein product [Penicillium salamii]
MKMQFRAALASLSLSFASTLATASITEAIASSDDSRQIQHDNLSSAEIFRRNSQVASRLSEGPARGVRKMSDDEGEKFFLDYWDFMGSTGDTDSQLPEGFNQTSLSTDFDNGYSPARLVGRSFPFGSSTPSVFGDGLQARHFKCPVGTWACTSIGRSDRCCGSGETCEIVKDTGHGDVGCCALGKTCNGMVGSCAAGYTACSQALGGGCCIPGYHCVEGGCAYITVVTVTVHSSVMLSTVTYSSIPQTSESPTSSPLSTSTGTNDGLVPPARPTSLSTATSMTRGDDTCPTGFYACSAVYHGGCCRTGRDCDTTSCPTTSSTTFISNGVTIVAPVETATEEAKATGNRCAKGWFHCADTVGGGCCPQGFACGASCTATDTASKTTVGKEQPTSGDGYQLGVSKILLFSVLSSIWMF